MTAYIHQPWLDLAALCSAFSALNFGLPMNLDRELGLPVEQNVPLAPYTTFKIGGPADYLVHVSQIEAMVRVVRAARRLGLPYLILGGGSNVLISDRGVRGLVIINRCRQVSFTPLAAGDDVLATAESGAPLAGLARRAIQEGCAGLEWAVSVPGTVGGAVVGNAGAHDGSVVDNLKSVEILDRDDEVQSWPATALELVYRSSVLKRAIGKAQAPEVVLSATFRLQRSQTEPIKARADSFLAHRRATQPVDASVGSIFRNPEGDYAGRVIEAVGMKGTRIGDAQVSYQHANFIVNLGNATAADVIALIAHIQAQVEDETGIRLAPEILFIGEDE